MHVLNTFAVDTNLVIDFFSLSQHVLLVSVVNCSSTALNNTRVIATIMQIRTQSNVENFESGASLVNNIVLSTFLND
jgi:hypothetical protein